MKTESLGAKTIQGIEVPGVRITVSRPGLITVEERWIAQDLGMALLLKRSDPRIGDDAQGVENIRREEPDPGLFIVPPDYRVEDMQ